MLNKIWAGFFVVGFAAALLQAFAGNPEPLSKVVQSTFDMSKAAIEICIGLAGMMCLWLGILELGKEGGAATVAVVSVIGDIPDRAGVQNRMQGAPMQAALRLVASDFQHESVCVEISVLRWYDPSQQQIRANEQKSAPAFANYSHFH